jgi:hypothetical protein
MKAIFTVDITVFAPLTRNRAVPVIAQQRLSIERYHLNQLCLIFLHAIRADLGLTTRQDRAAIDRAIIRFLASAPLEFRSAFIATDPDWVIRNLRAYQVLPLDGGDDNYRIQPENLFPYWAGLAPEVTRSGVHAVMIFNPNDNSIHASVDAAIGVDAQLLRLRQIGRLVESGLRASPGVSGYRRLAGGSRGWVWTADSPHNLVDQP